MQPRPVAETSRLCFPSLRCCIISRPFETAMRVDLRRWLVMLPSYSPAFIRAIRLHDELVAGKVVYAFQIFADKGPHQCALDVIGEAVSAFVDLIGPKGGLVSALRVLNRRGVGPCLRILIHHLDRHVTVARVDKQPSAVSPVNFAVCALLLEPGKAPRSDELSPDSLISTVNLAAGQRHCDHTDRQSDHAERKRSFHCSVPRHSWLPAFSLQTYKRALFKRYPDPSYSLPIAVATQHFVHTCSGLRGTLG